MSALVVRRKLLTPPASAAHTHAITARTWCFTSGALTRFQRSALSEEMIDLVTRYRIEEVALLDSNFPVDFIGRSISRAASSDRV